MTSWKKALIAGAAIAGFLVLFLAVATLLLPAERIGRMAVAHAESVLDREVRIEDFGIRILPRPAVTLRRVEVSRHARPTDVTPDAEASVLEDLGPLLASAARIDLRPRILPLLRGRVEIHELFLDEAALFLIVPEGGTLDLPTFEEEAEGEPAEIRIRSVRLRDGRIEYMDGNTGNALSMAGIDHRLGIDGPLTADAAEPLGLEGTLSVREIAIHFPEAFDRPVTVRPLRVEHRAILVRAEDRLDLERLDVTLADFPVSVAGSVHAFSDPEARTVALDARTGVLEVGRLVRSLPPEVLGDLPRGPEGSRLEGTAGTVELEAAARGRWAEDEVPDVSGRLEFDGVELAFTGEGLRRRTVPLVQDGAGAVRFTADSAASDALAGRLLGEPFQAAFRVHDFGAPRGSASFRGALDLVEAGRAAFLPEGVEGRGRLLVDVSATGAPADPATVRVDGRLGLEGIALFLDALARPLALADGGIDLDGARVHARGLRLTAGTSDALLDLEVRNWPTFALAGDEGALAASFDFRSTVLDLDDLLGVDPDRTPYGQLLFAHLGEQRLDGRTAPQVAEEMGLGVPRVPGFAVDGRVRAGTLVSNGLAHQDLDATLATRAGDLQIPSATLRTMGGRAELGAWLGRGTGEPDALRPLALTYAVTGVTADPFLEHHTLFRGRVGGTLVLTGSAEMRLRPDALPERESLVGEGTVGVRDGELRNWPLVWELGRTVGLGFETLAFRDWTGNYMIAGSRILIEESHFEGRELTARASGSFDVAGNLDLSATFHFPAVWMAGIPGVPAGLAASVLADPEGRIPVGATVRGTTTAPSIGLDLTEVGAIAAGRAREEAERRIREEAERLSRELGLELPVPAAPVEADTLRTRLEEELRTRLRRLIPRGGGTPGGR